MYIAERSYQFTFSTLQDSTSRLKTLSKDIPISFLRQLPCIFIQSLVDFSADFDTVDLARGILEALSNQFNDSFDDVETTVEEIINILRKVYCHLHGGSRTTDQLSGDCVRNSTLRTDDDADLLQVGHALDPIFIQESNFNSVGHLGSFLDAIGGFTSPIQGTMFVDRNARKIQIVSWLFSFREYRVPIISVFDFTARLFPETSEDHLKNFRQY